MEKEIINIENLKVTLREKFIEDKGGLYKDNTKIKNLIEVLQSQDEDLGLDIENTLIDYIYNIAAEFYNTGFDDARLFLSLIHI